ncbi:LBP_cg2779 family protein [Lentilactobacillus sp. SPB1-3]|uniref:LBP_cg2779 family protein n=1 Tax=Lentilactobacillus terminaliae TaxID=3003483 RepID=A0ACD5DFK7_9LACO|nr:LBP_cg2779 family protein [Lentilactobacillus sp. SPB1-3]MCZ0976568.1 LBP_cg2779 family protein [Lentilactobacillus sp. SPB1-3]
MADEFSNLAEEIINYQKKHEMPDTQLAFNLHITVERLHDIKSMESGPSDEERSIIEKFIR